VAATRQNINIELADGAKVALERVRQRNGMTQKELVGRLIQWFCAEDEVLQQVILGQIPEAIAPDVARIVLQRIADAAPDTLDHRRAVTAAPGRPAARRLDADADADADAPTRTPDSDAEPRPALMGEIPELPRHGR